jgi:hypothetical protein
MKSSCARCGGYIIGERATDYYQARRWRCINCGWYREDVVAPRGRAVRLYKPGAIKPEGNATISGWKG